MRRDMYEKAALWTNCDVPANGILSCGNLVERHNGRRTSGSLAS